MILLITGGRHYHDISTIHRVLYELAPSAIIHGCAKGADSHAATWAALNNITQYRHPITAQDWQDYGRKAGPLRNASMLFNDPRPDMCVAFPGGTGTADMVKRCENISLPVLKI